MKKNKSENVLQIVFMVCFCIFTIITVLNTITNLNNRKYDSDKLLAQIENDNELKSSPLNLTPEQKVEDFEFLFDTLVDNIPMIDCYDEVYGFNFADRKDYYLQCINNTKDDFEFFCTMQAIANEIPSCHTSVICPTIDNYKTIAGYDTYDDLATPSIALDWNYWENVLLNNVEKYSDESTILFAYVDGKYAYINHDPELSGVYDGYTLEKVNGIGVNEYINKQIMMSNLSYDGKYNLAYRQTIVFNRSRGSEVTLLYNDCNGKEVTEKAYYDIFIEDAWLNQLSLSSARTSDCEIHEGDDYVYINVFEMDYSTGEEIADRLKDNQKDKVILDMRECTGGSQMCIFDFLYPSLFNTTVKDERTWYTTDYNLTMRHIDRIFADLLTSESLDDDELSPYSSHDEYYKISTSKEYIGGEFPTKKVVILTSSITASAADGFVSLVKKNKLGTVIGNNTNGEGLAGSYHVDICPESKLVFSYMPGGAKNPDNTDNSVIGTAPDIYVTQTIDEFFTMLKSENELNDENWDTILSYDPEIRRAISELAI